MNRFDFRENQPIFVIMKQFQRCVAVAVLLTSAAFDATLLSGQTTSVLWLGNSYIYTNNLPDMLYQLALSGGDTIVYDSNTPGGYTLEDHWNSLTTQYKINQQPWDYVIVQAQSQEPALDSAFVTNWVLPYADALDSIIHLNDSCTQTMFFMTWGRKNGDAQNCAAYPPVCTYQGMQDQLRNRYLQMGYDNGAAVAPCGEAWRDVIATNPTFDLYSPDESHPSLHGSYLNACVFYASIYRRSPVGLTYYGGLPANEAQMLQQIASDCVLDSMSVWNTEVYYDNPGFQHSLMSGTTYLFNASTQNSTHQWNFGSGWMAGSANEAYTFPANGTYLVMHVTSNGCHTDTSSQWITVGPQSVWNCIPESRKHVVTYPSPATDVITIVNPFSESKPCLVEIVNFYGVVMKTESYSGKEFSVSVADLPDGFYTVRLRQDVKVLSSHPFLIMRN